MQITQNGQTDKTDETDQTEADQTDKTNVLARYNARGVVRELSNMRNCQFPVSMSESVTTISARDASASENGIDHPPAANLPQKVKQQREQSEPTLLPKWKGLRS